MSLPSPGSAARCRQDRGDQASGVRGLRARGPAAPAYRGLEIHRSPRADARGAAARGRPRRLISAILPAPGSRSRARAKTSLSARPVSAFASTTFIVNPSAVRPRLRTGRSRRTFELQRQLLAAAFHHAPPRHDMHDVGHDVVQEPLVMRITTMARSGERSALTPSAATRNASRSTGNPFHRECTGSVRTAPSAESRCVSFRRPEEIRH